MLRNNGRRKEPTDHFPGGGKCVAYHMAMTANKQDSKTQDRVTAKSGNTVEENEGTSQ